MDRAAFVKLRPWAYHLTPAPNWERAKRLGRLVCAAELLAAAGKGDLVGVRRPAGVDLVIDGEPVWVADQKPLKANAIRYDAEGWDFARFVAHLNARVFFWPGGRSGMVARGRRHLACVWAAGARPVLIRMGTAELFAANPDAVIEVSRCNSGAPRGRALRGASTFTEIGACEYGAAEVGELTLVGAARLPAGVAVSADGGVTWEEDLPPAETRRRR